MFEKIKTVIKEHKNEIIIGAIGIVIGGCGYAIGSKYISVPIPLPGDRVLMPGFSIEDGLTVADIGKLGDEFIKHDPVLTKNTRILSVGKFEFE